MDDRLGEPVTINALPAVELLAGEALADGVGGIEDYLFKVVQALHEVVQGRRSFLLLSCCVVGWNDVPVQLGHRAAPLGHLGVDMAILLLHIFEQLILGDDVTLLGGVEERGKP